MLYVTTGNDNDGKVHRSAPESAQRHVLLRRRQLAGLRIDSSPPVDLPSAALDPVPSGRWWSRILIMRPTNSASRSASTAQARIPSPITAVVLIGTPGSMAGIRG